MGLEHKNVGQPDYIQLVDQFEKDIQDMCPALLDYMVVDEIVDVFDGQ